MNGLDYDAHRSDDRYLDEMDTKNREDAADARAERRFDKHWEASAKFLREAGLSQEWLDTIRVNARTYYSLGWSDATFAEAQRRLAELGDEIDKVTNAAKEGIKL